MSDSSGYRSDGRRPQREVAGHRAIPEISTGTRERNAARASSDRSRTQSQNRRNAANRSASPQGAVPGGKTSQDPRLQTAQGRGGRGVHPTRGQDAQGQAARSRDAVQGQRPSKGQGQARAQAAQAQGEGRRQDSSRRRSAATKKKVANDVEIVYPDGYRPIDRDKDSRGDYGRAFYRSKRDEDAESSRGIFKILLVIVASIVYWPVALVGIISPFMEGFNPGTLAMWQVVFSRFWLAFVLLGAIYALVINLGGVRNARIFRGRRRMLKIVLFVIADFAASFVLLRLVCLF